MRFILIMLLAVGLTSSAQSLDKPKVAAALISTMSQRLDVRLSRLMPEDPVTPIGLTQGAYIPGYGAVFMSTLNLAPMAGLSPFHQSVSKEELTRIHQKKAERIPKLKDAIQEMLVNLAASLDPVPPEEQIAVAISLFYFNGESTTGLPAQVVMHAQKKALLDGKSNKALLASAVHVEEF